ncbi:MAG: pyridoxal phosphate-dependent aminotransferase [Firmicutes bacterium]|nr:pyridoxal phosphate-dependent aminotransferase [Bacillota bacterium]
MIFSEKMKLVKPSSTIALTAKSTELKAQGLDVVGFAAGEPDFGTPEHIVDAAKAAMDAGFTKYTPASGTLELREAICKKHKEDNGLEYRPEQIVVSNGAKHSIMNAFMAILNPGDEVIIPGPFWLSYSEMVVIAGGVPVIVNTKAENSFVVTREELEAAKSPNTKAIIFNSPSNPTGMVYSEADIRMMAEFVIENDLIVISDEIYEKLIYTPDKKHISIASLGEEIYSRTIVINGVSKAYSMTGWRIGWSASSVELAKIMSSAQSQMTSGPCSISQKAAVAAVLGDQSCVEEMRKAFAERMEYIHERVNNMPYLSALKPEGAFYLFVDVTGAYGKKAGERVINSAADFVDVLLNDKLVVAVPCADFAAPGHLRFSYATSMEQIKKGMDRLEEFVKELK